MKKVLSLLICASCLFSVCFAASFSDMPNDWSTPALENAVKNGLITGSNGMILPHNNLTRAEMATIMVRAFGANEGADISGFVDVKKSDWFYPTMAIAVEMGAFTGDGAYLYPTNNITRQETFAVLARMFSLNYDKEINDFFGTGTPADTVLSQFEDGDEVASWAKDLVAAIIESGYVNGNNGYINPTDYITRAEFAAVMDRMVKTYIDNPGKYTSFPEGNVIIRSEDVEIDGATVSGDLIIGEGAGKGANMNLTTVTGRYVARAGKDNIIQGGKCGSIRIIKSGVTVTGSNVERDVIYAVEGAEFIEALEFNMDAE